MSIRSLAAARAPAVVALALALAACFRGASPADAAPATAPLTATPDGRPLKLTFDEEFNSFRPYVNGQGVWRTVFRNGQGDPIDLRTLKGNRELQLYVDPSFGAMGLQGAPPLGLNPFRLHDGVLDIIGEPASEAMKAKLGGYGYTSGLITTQPSFAQAYGYFEMRARLPRGKGVWPAFWLLPTDLSWPPELDVMESIGDPGKIYVTSHSKLEHVPGTPVDIDPEGFHVFAVSWDPQQLVWYVDGREIDRQPTPPDMTKPMYLLANVAVGGNWPGSPDATTRWPARMSIDYIRAYRFAR